LPEKSDLKRWFGLTAEKDTPVLASALSGKADVLVTGDKRHLLKSKNADLPFEILSPAEFIDELLPRLLKNI
jgi:predicted nucleic acid-binding protein